MGLRTPIPSTQADVAVALQPLPAWRCSWVGLDPRPKQPRLRDPRGGGGGAPRQPPSPKRGAGAGGFSTSSSGGFTSASELLASSAAAGGGKRRAVGGGEKARGVRSFF